MIGQCGLLRSTHQYQLYMLGYCIKEVIPQLSLDIIGGRRGCTSDGKAPAARSCSWTKARGRYGLRSRASKSDVYLSTSSGRVHQGEYQSSFFGSLSLPAKRRKADGGWARWLIVHGWVGG